LANYNRLGRACDVHDPEAYEHDLYVHAHANQWTREDANARSIENAKRKSEANLAKRAFVQETREKSSPRFLPSVSKPVGAPSLRRRRENRRSRRGAGCRPGCRTTCGVPARGGSARRTGTSRVRETKCTGA
jgi:hypothetical protein